MASACVNVCRCQVFPALMVALMVVVPDEGRDVCCAIAGQDVIFQQDAVFERLVPTFYFALSLWMIRRAARMRHALAFQIVGQISRDIARTVVRQQTGTMNDLCLIEPCLFQRLVQRVLNVLCGHAGAEFPSDDLATVVIQDRAEIEPTPPLTRQCIAQQCHERAITLR
jgi:hypothetical protein